MKKLLLGAAITLGSIVSINAQTTILAQPFGTSSIPGGWSENTPAVATDNWKFTKAWGTKMAKDFSMQGYCACVDDWDNNSAQIIANYDTLKGPVMNCSAYSTVYISLNYFFYNDDGAETAQILYSTNGGTTWTQAINLPNTQSTSTGWSNNAIFNISSYVGGKSNVMIAFAYYDGVGDPSNNGYVACGIAVQDVDVYAPANYEVQVESQNNARLVQVGTAYHFSGTDSNFGTSAITSMNMNYSVNHGPTVTQTISGISGFGSLTSYNWSMNSSNSQFIPSSAGIDTVRFWTSNMNGSNSNATTDTLIASFLAVNSIWVKQALYEEFTGQSCVFCMVAGPNLDSVSANNASTSNIIKYHVPIPGRDFMYDITTSAISPRKSYYSVSSAPQGFLDGTSLNPSGYNNPPITERYSTVTVQNDNALGSLFNIVITSANYDVAKDSFSISANITASAAFATGLKAQVALTLDSITYYDDLSTDDPTKTFAPPIGSNAGGYSYTGAPDSYYQYVLKFPHVVEAMLPNGNGTSLNAFTAGQTQTISLGWKKSHAWGQYPKGGGTNLGDSTLYDSSATGQLVVFVQTNSAISSYGIPAKYVFQSAAASLSNLTGMQEISNGIYFELYPNPATNNTNIAFKLNEAQNVDIAVYNMLGEQVYSANKGSMSAGSHIIMINSSSLPNGMYFVKFNTGNACTTNKLIIQR